MCDVAELIAQIGDYLACHAPMQAAPIVRVAVEPAVPREMARLQEGLRLLNRADPFVEVGLVAAPIACEHCR